MESLNKVFIKAEDKEDVDSNLVITHVVPPMPEEKFRIFVTVEIKDTNLIKHMAVSESSRATISKKLLCSLKKILRVTKKKNRT